MEVLKTNCVTIQKEYDFNEYEEINLEDVLKLLIKYPSLIEHNYIQNKIYLIIQEMKEKRHSFSQGSPAHL